ncbi:tRNA pseudouridine(13) synthase TruD [Thermosulfurimonas marina]|uniref:tRNA pseudouridine(13) synthase TruD n=1 Tax=Thermosulfurimonas marina TaxID=2047767 RepID=A0A6H1WST1_9BACT|nr:tRNA pseudouridine(13) synthase TruD [Thermosulfurimonas marina]QJA06230.1 tRNA pseudouridine(13) synthase TruD [Thermosulfurimonas marina]
MRIKEIPEDFVVYEVADMHPEGRGEFALYRLRKKGLTTWDVLGEVARRLRLRQDLLGYGGLKDRHALSHQFVTIPHGPRRDLHGEGWHLEYLGQVTAPMKKSRLKGNFFEITVREVDLSEEDLWREVEAVQTYGVPNYFDEQRFGSVRHGQGFAAREAVLGNFERALYLLLVEGSQYEYRRTEAFRDCLRQNWPRVAPCLSLAPSPWERRLLEFLSSHRPSKRTFKRAFALVDREYLLMLAQAYQAYLWNEVLKALLQREGLVHFRVPYLLGELFFYERLPEEALSRLRVLKLPLPSPKLRVSAELSTLYEEVLRREGIEGLSRLRTLVKGLVFKTYPREALVFPQELSFRLAPDERHPGARKAVFRFFLPRGAYATLVLKRLFRRPL